MFTQDPVNSKSIFPASLLVVVCQLQSSTIPPKLNLVPATWIDDLEPENLAKSLSGRQSGEFRVRASARQYERQRRNCRRARRVP
jgi:hypothetical protein